MNEDLSFEKVLNDSVNYLETLKQYGVEYFNLKKDSPKLLNYEIMTCSFCNKAKKIKPIKFSNLNIKLLFIVDMPKDFENQRVFSSNERVMFRKIISAMNLRVDQVFVISALKCQFLPEDVQAKKNDFLNLPCKNFLKRTIKFINPQCICFLGNSMFEIINKDLNHIIEKYPVFSTHSLDTLDVQPDLKKESWEVFKKIIASLKSN
ncbi:MAG: uracil-DNA glycosylase family protein [Desulforegulaceae bacterium]|nr:uracil-DNA glycosylase family protein [Desulforegulaceae bacterium]